LFADLIFLVCLTSTVFWVSEAKKLFERQMERRAAAAYFPSGKEHLLEYV